MKTIQWVWRGVALSIMLVLAAVLTLNDKSAVRADDLPVIHVSGTLQSNQTWTPSAVYVIDSTVTVPNGISLTINPGTIIKYVSAWWNNGITIDQGGSLTAHGSAAQPISLTSIKDDTLGGDSGNDGNTIGTPGEYNYGFILNGSASLQHIKFSYASIALEANCNSPSPVTVRDSSFDGSVNLNSCAKGVVVFERNIFQGSGWNDALTMNNSEVTAVSLEGTNKNTFTGQGRKKVISLKNARVDTGSSWAVSDESGAVIKVNNLAVNGSLTLGSGLIVKFDSHWANQGINVGTSGHLQTQGAPADQVIFTSIKDDYHGGDSGADGQTTGSVDDYMTAIGGTGDITLTGALIMYAGEAMNYQCQPGKSLQLTDNDFRSGLQLSNCDAGQATLQSNDFTLPASKRAILLLDVEMSGIALSGSDKNIFTGTGKAITVFLKDTHISQGGSWEVQSESGAILHVGSLEVYGHLSVGPGVVIKGDTHWANHGIWVQDGGMADIEGITASPVVFTSIKDDAIGGDSGGDGVSTGAPDDYPTAITNSDGIVTVSHARFAYASSATFGGCGASGSIQVSDSLLESGMYINSCSQGRLSLQRNQFNVAKGYAIQANYTAMTGVIMDGSEQNSFQGSGQGATIFWNHSSIDSGDTWVVGDRGATLYISTATINGTLNIKEGVVIKGDPGWQSKGLLINQGGVLDITGTPASPVRFTSIKDDSIRGDSKGDGSTTGASGDYPTAIVVQSGGSASVSHTSIKYASDVFQNGGSIEVDNTLIDSVSSALYTASGEANIHAHISNASYRGLIVAGTAHVIMRGSMTNIGGKAIEACKWSQACFVDATYVDWGDASGPFPPNSSRVCGKVAVSPWIVGSSTQGGDVFQVKDCNNPTSPADSLSSSVESYNNRINPKKIDCSYGIQDACDQVDRMLACVSAAANLAMYNSPFPAPNSSPGEQAITYVQDLTTGASTYLNASADPSPIAFATDFFDKLLGVANIWGSLQNAYSSCN